MHTSQKCVKRAETLPVDEYGLAVNMSSPLFVLSNTENLSVSFCGSGFLATYQLGVAQSLLDNAPWILRGAPRVYGASAGSLVAAAVVCGSNLGRVRDNLLEFARYSRQLPLGLLSPTADVYRWLEVTLERSLPDNAHSLASGRLHISMTRIPDGKNVLVSEFQSNEDLIRALLCSCFVPLYSGMIPPQYKGEHYMDGGFTNIQPFEDTSPTLTISPFAGEMDICPSDTSTTFCDVIIQQLSFHCSMPNLIRLLDAMFPRDWRILKKAFYSGYQDTIYFLERSKALQLYPDRRMESDVSDDSGTSDSLSSDHWMLTQTDAEDRDQQEELRKSVKEVSSSQGPSRYIQEVSKVQVQEVLLCNIVGQLEIMSDPKVSLSQRTLSFLLFLFTLPIWSATTFASRYQKWITHAVTVTYWVLQGCKLFVIFIFNIFLSTMWQSLRDMMMSLISFVPSQVHAEYQKARQLIERRDASNSFNVPVSTSFQDSSSISQTLPNLYTLLRSLEIDSKWKKHKIEVQHTILQHMIAKRS
ncbi:patatin-like phospholipase domain-containing protein 2 isoform X1 [Triplophysa dalaica]|uniref:patatin-like phospholipase domain-containing protein 2 isoform X1 n=1 Tax=Triplophysa dalaica TaxID=1582913 RepID=UPI0024DFEA63|nr:patatin-like phospholipase domain-containing protein 2 isoform X1 [Triplophysa dalaica]